VVEMAYGRVLAGLFLSTLSGHTCVSGRLKNRALVKALHGNVFYYMLL
jgi:hypothetical protein